MGGDEIYALFGGSFDPVHAGHVAMARAVLARGYAGRVVVMPARVSPHKVDRGEGNEAADGEDRLVMLRFAFEGMAGVEVATDELERPGPSYTWQTLELLRRTRPGVKWRLVVGWDQYVALPTWSRFKEWGRTVEYLVFRRVGESGEVPAELEGVSAKVVEAAVPEVSSSEIRERVAAGRPVAEMLPPGVEDYIRARGLYRG